MEEGWIKLHRNMRDWQWYTDVPVKTLFIHMLISANHTPKNWRGILVERGQFLTGRKMLSDETGLTEMQVRSALAKLKNSGEITSKITNKFTVITICNYEAYQKKDGEGIQQDNQQVTNKQPTNNQQITTTKNEKNEKKESGKIPISASMDCFDEFWSAFEEGDGHDVPHIQSDAVPVQNDAGRVIASMDCFEKFWSAYPKKVGLDAAKRAWKKIKQPAATLEAILTALEWQKKTSQWKDANGQYIPNPSTYLNQGRWKDEPVKVEPEHRPPNAQVWY